MNEKLVRDLIPLKSAEAQDGRSFRVASYGEMPSLLARKLIEEAGEVVTELATASSSNPDKLVEELADLSEVIDALLEHYCVPKQNLLVTRAQKRRAKGAFGGKFVLDLRTNPERFQK